MVITDRKSWYLYVVECSDGSYYTGITTDCYRRVYEHNRTKRGAKYTRARRPVELVYRKYIGTRSDAAKAELKFKELTRKEKNALVRNIDNVLAPIRVGDLVTYEIATASGHVATEIGIVVKTRRSATRKSKVPGWIINVWTGEGTTLFLEHELKIISMNNS